MWAWEPGELSAAEKQHQSDSLGSDSFFPLAGGGSGKSQTFGSKLNGKLTVFEVTLKMKKDRLLNELFIPSDPLPLHILLPWAVGMTKA